MYVEALYKGGSGEAYLTRPSVSFSLTLLVLVACSMAAFFPLETNSFLPLRVAASAAGIVLLFFLTGYWAAKLFRKYLPTQLTFLEQACLSVGTSLVIAIIVNSILSTFYVVSALSVFLAFGGLSLALAVASEVLRWRRVNSDFHLQLLKASGHRWNFFDFPSFATVALCAGVVSFVFFIHPFALRPSLGLAYSFVTNGNLLDLALLILVASFLIYRFRNQKRLATFANVMVLTIALLLALKARGDSALVSFGLGDRVGIDSWDSLGHLISFVGSGKYSLTEPFLLMVKNGQILSSPNPLPSGYFSLMGAASMLLGVDPLSLTRSVFLFGVLQVLFIYLLAKKLTGDTNKALISAILIGCGAAMSENVKFSSGALSPIAAVGLALVPFGLYILALSKTKFTRFLVVLVALGLLYVHLASAIVFILVALVLFLVQSGKAGSIKKRLQTFRTRVLRNKSYVGVVCAVLLAISAPIALFWCQTYANPDAANSIHYSERFTFSLPTAQEFGYVPSFVENALFFVLLAYGLASYFFAKSHRKERDFLLYWNVVLLALYLLLFYTNPKIAYRILAYLYQSVFMTAGCAFVYDVLDRWRPKVFSWKKGLAAFLLLVTLLFAAICPVYTESSTPDGMFLQQSTQQRPYFDLANWIRANLTSTCAIVVNNCTSFSDPVNILRDMGVMTIMGPNVTLNDYVNINALNPNSYILEAPQYPPAVSCQNSTIVYTSQIGNNGSYLTLYSVTSVLAAFDSNSTGAI
jgi:hypothetical protein